MSRLEVLISCMNEIGFDIIPKSNIKCNALIINQCNESCKKEKKQDNFRICKISTTSRGLSRSRNLAIDNCKNEIALLCDDDEVFIDNMHLIIENNFDKYKDDILIFDFKDRDKRLGTKYKRLSKLELLKVSSWQIAFRVSSIKKAKLEFDINLGAGTPNGAGEENDFLLKAHKAGLSIAYVPIVIGELIESESSWFKGYDEEYFIKRGSSTRYILGFVLSSLYALHFLIKKYKLYSSNISFLKAFFSIFKGILLNKLSNNNS